MKTAWTQGIFGLKWSFSITSFLLFWFFFSITEISVLALCALALEPPELILSSKDEIHSSFLCVSFIINTNYAFHQLSILEQQENFGSRSESHRSTEKKRHLKDAEKFWQRHVFIIHYFNPLSYKIINSAWWSLRCYIAPLIGLSSPSSWQFAFLLNNSQKLGSKMMTSLMSGVAG